MRREQIHTMTILSLFVVILVSLLALDHSYSQDQDSAQSIYLKKSKLAWEEVIHPKIRYEIHETVDEAQIRGLKALENFWISNPRNYFIGLVQLQQDPLSSQVLKIIEQRIQSFSFNDDPVVLRLAIFLYPSTDPIVRRSMEILLLQTIIQNSKIKKENFQVFKSNNKFLMNLISNSKTKIYMRLFKLVKEYFANRVRLENYITQSPENASYREELAKLDMDFNRNLHEASHYVYAEISERLEEKLYSSVELLKTANTNYMDSNSFFESVYWQLHVLLSAEFRPQLFELSMKVLGAFDANNEFIKVMKAEIFKFWSLYSVEIAKLFDRNIRLAEEFVSISSEQWWYSDLEQEEFFKELYDKIESSQVQELLVEKLSRDFLIFLKIEKKQREFNWEQNDYKTREFIEFITRVKWNKKIFFKIKEVIKLLEQDSQMDFHLLSRLHFEIQKRSDLIESFQQTKAENNKQEFYRDAFKIASQDSTPKITESPRVHHTESMESKNNSIWISFKNWLMDKKQSLMTNSKVSSKTPSKSEIIGLTHRCRELIAPKNIN